MAIGAGERGHAFSLAGIMSDAPAGSGVYALFDTDWIYFGDGDNIRQRLLQHLREVGTCLHKRPPTGFAFELLDAVAREQRRAALVRTYLPPCNPMNAS
jgi:hypothetical protein